MLKALLIGMLAAPGCAYVSYERGTRFRAVTVLKDYGLRGVSLDREGLGIGSLSGATDAAAVEGLTRGAAEGAARGVTGN